MHINQNSHTELLKLTATIVSAYAGNNAVSGADLPRVISGVFNQLADLGRPEAEPEPSPAVPVKKSLTNEAVTCLECGRKLQTLKRHLRQTHNITPESYKAKWKLKHDYPMVSPKYKDIRRELARKIGLGRN